MPVDFNFMVGGEAGQGVQSLGFLLAKVFARGGYHIFADQDYESRVRGGHNFFRVRVKDKRPQSLCNTASDSLIDTGWILSRLVFIPKLSKLLHH